MLFIFSTLNRVGENGRKVVGSTCWCKQFLLFTFLPFSPFASRWILFPFDIVFCRIFLCTFSLTGTSYTIRFFVSWNSYFHCLFLLPPASTKNQRSLPRFTVVWVLYMTQWDEKIFAQNKNWKHTKRSIRFTIETFPIRFVRSIMKLKTRTSIQPCVSKRLSFFLFKWNKQEQQSIIPKPLHDILISRKSFIPSSSESSAVLQIVEAVAQEVPRNWNSFSMKNVYQTEEGNKCWRNPLRHMLSCFRIARVCGTKGMKKFLLLLLFGETEKQNLKQMCLNDTIPYLLLLLLLLLLPSSYIYDYAKSHF